MFPELSVLIEFNLYIKSNDQQKQCTLPYYDELFGESLSNHLSFITS